MSERVRNGRRRKARRNAKRASTGAALVSGAILIGVVAGGGTYALWQGNAEYNAGVLIPADGEASLRFAIGDPASATAAFTNLLPGESKTIPVLLENDGDFDLDITAELTATTGTGYALRLEIDDACTTSGFLPSPYLTDPALITNTPAAIGSIGDGATRILCVQVTADSGIVPSSAMTFDATISGDSGS